MPVKSKQEEVIGGNGHSGSKKVGSDSFLDNYGPSQDFIAPQEGHCSYEAILATALSTLRRWWPTTTASCTLEVGHRLAEVEYNYGHDSRLHNNRTKIYESIFGPVRGDLGQIREVDSDSGSDSGCVSVLGNDGGVGCELLKFFVLGDHGGFRR